MPEALLVLIGLGPFIFSSLTLETDNLRQFVFLLALSLSISGGIANTQADQKTTRLNLCDWFILIFLSLRVLSCKWGTEYLWYSFPTVFIEGMLGLSYLFLRLQVTKQKKAITMASALIVSIVCVNFGQWVLPEYFKPVLQNRYSAQFFHPNLQGIYACVCLCLLLDERVKGKLLALSLGLVSWSVWLCQSRTALVALILILVYYSNKKTRVALLLLSPIVFGFWFYGSNHSMEKFRLNLDTSTDIKLSVYESVINSIKDNPLGLGPGLMAERINPYLSESFHYWMPNPAQNSLHNAHNAVLHYVCESGWLILIPMFIFIYYCVLDFYRRRSLSILVLVGTSLVDVHLQQFSSQLLLIYLLATHQQVPLQIPAIPITLQPLLLPIALTLGIMAPLLLHQQIYSGFLKSALISSQNVKDLKKYRETLEFNPWPIPVLKVQYLKLGSLIEEGHYDRALSDALKLHQLFSGYYLMEHIIGRLYLLKQEPDLALIWAEKAIDFHPMEEDNYFLLAEIYNALGEAKNADDSMKQYLSLALRNRNFRDLYISSQKSD